MGTNYLDWIKDDPLTKVFDISRWDADTIRKIRPVAQELGIDVAIAEGLKGPISLVVAHTWDATEFWRRLGVYQDSEAVKKLLERE
jgi:hypothetical protein